MKIFLNDENFPDYSILSCYTLQVIQSATIEEYLLNTETNVPLSQQHDHHNSNIKLLISLIIIIQLVATQL